MLGRGSRGYGLCLILGALAGMASTLYTNRRLEVIQSRYGGATILLEAEAESVSPSYYEGVVDAVLHVQQVEGVAADFHVECLNAPICDAGDVIRGRFSLEVPTDDAQNVYADGIDLEAEYQRGYTLLGQSTSFRARTARLQKHLSEGLRSELSSDEAGVLAAMVAGDRNYLSREMNSAYRAAGLSHVLVVSGMHVTILCGGFLPRRKRLQSYASRRVGAVLRALMALLLVGVTGMTPSVMRAAVAVWVSALGVWIYGPADTLTSLALAGFLMTMGNSYAVCDIGFELSFAAVLGTSAGSELDRRGRAAFERAHPRTTAKPRLWQRGAGWLWDTLCVSACASAATFPVLVLRGLCASLYALVSSVTVLWLVDPLMILGLGAAVTSLVPFAEPVRYALAWCAGLLTRVINQWAVMVSGWPGAQIRFDTAYAAVVCLILMALCWLASRWKVRLRVSVPTVALAAVIAVGAGNALNRDVVRVELTGTAASPAAVITCNDGAIVLFRGSVSTQRSIENLLQRRGIRRAALLIDLRTDPHTLCTVETDMNIFPFMMDAYDYRVLKEPWAKTEILRTQDGYAVRIEAAGRYLITLGGDVRLATPVEADWLLASSSDPACVDYQNILALSDGYSWMEGVTVNTASFLALRPDGGMRVQS